MRNIIYLILIFLSSCLSVKQNINAQTLINDSTVVEYYDNGKKKKVIPYYNGVKHGIVKGFDIINGNLVTEAYYKKGEKLRLTIYYRDTSVIKTIMSYRNGDVISIIYFKKNSEIAHQEIYHDKNNGTMILYENGKIKDLAPISIE